MVMLPTNAAKWMPSGNIKDLVKNSKVVENATMHGAKRNAPVYPPAMPMQHELEIKPNNLPQMTENNSDDQVEIPIRKISKPILDKPNPTPRAPFPSPIPMPSSAVSPTPSSVIPVNPPAGEGSK